MQQDTEQPVNLEELQAEQEVYGSDGEYVGQIEGLNEDRETGEQYLVVAAGLLKQLYLPKHEIAYAVIGKPIRLKVPAAEAKERFTTRPNIL